MPKGFPNSSLRPLDRVASRRARRQPMLGAARNRGDWMALARPSPAAVRSRLLRLPVPGGGVRRNDFSCSTSRPLEPSLPVDTRRRRVGGHEGSIRSGCSCSRSVPRGRDGQPAPARQVVSRISPSWACSRSASCCSCSRPRILRRLLPSPPTAATNRSSRPRDGDPSAHALHGLRWPLGRVLLPVAALIAAISMRPGRAGPCPDDAAWIFLTLGIALAVPGLLQLGWRLVVWDPVENPRSCPGSRHRADPFARRHRSGTLQDWTCCSPPAFSLSLLGTFSSARACSRRCMPSQRPERGLSPRLPRRRHRLVALALCWRATSVASAHARPGLARDAAALEHVLLVVPAARCCSHAHPLALDAMNLGNISVGAPYLTRLRSPADAARVPVASARWRGGRRQTARPSEAAECRPAAPSSRPSWSRGRRRRRIVAATALLMAFWIIASVATDLVERLRPPRHRATVVHRARQIPRALVGMCRPLGARSSSSASRSCATGDSSATCRWPSATRRRSTHVFTFNGRATSRGRTTARPRRDRRDQDGRALATLTPKLFYPASQSTMPSVDRRRPHAHLYVSLGEAVAGGAWIVRIYVNPSSTGSGRLPRHALGGLLAATDRASREGARAAASGRLRRLRHEGLWFLVPRRRSALAFILSIGLKRDPREVPPASSTSLRRSSRSPARRRKQGRAPR